MRNKFDENRDVPEQEDRSLMCQAAGCPERWSIDFGNGRLCHWHDTSPKHDWPTVTWELEDMKKRGVKPVYRASKAIAR